MSDSEISQEKAKKPRKPATSVHTEYTSVIPCLVELYERFGRTKASKMLGLTDVGHLIRAGKARPAYEIAARALLAEQMPKEDRQVRSFVVKMKPEQIKVVQPIIDALGIPYMELDF